VYLKEDTVPWYGTIRGCLFITAVPINSLIGKLFVGGGGYVFYERRRAEALVD